MSTPTIRPEFMPGQAMNETTLACDAFSRGLSPYRSEIQGIKRKASRMESAQSSPGATQSCPPIKLEPSSPAHFDSRTSNMKNILPDYYVLPTAYLNSTGNHDMEDQIFDVHEDQDFTTMRPSSKPLAAEVGLAMSSTDISVPLKEDARTDSARVTLPKNVNGTNGFLRPVSKVDNFPPLRWQKESRRPKIPRPVSKNQNEDVDYNSIPDYTPPLSTLPTGNPHILQVHWRKKSSVDLSDDPDRHMLHEAELELATILNLSCAKYLCTKRRIFGARLKALQAGREFRRVDSQKAAKINSNKAGKLLHGKLEFILNYSTFLTWV